MGLLDFRPTAIKPAGETYLDYYRNYRGPHYSYVPDTPSALKTTGGYTGKQGPNDSGQPYSSGGYGGEGQNGEGYSSRGSRADAAITGENLGYGLASTLGQFGTGMALNAMAPGLGTLGNVTGLNAKAGQAFAGLLGQRSNNDIVNNAERTNTPIGLSGWDIAAAQADAQAAENDAARAGYGMPGSESLGVWGGGDYGPGGALSGDSGGASQGNAEAGMGDSYGGGFGDSYGGSDGWKNGGMIRPKRGLLDHEDDSMMGEQPVYGLLDGPKTKKRDNIPAVNVRTGEKIAVETGEMVMPRDVVKKKKKVLTKMIKTHHKED